MSDLMKVGFATVDWSRSVRDEAFGKPAMGGANWIRFGQYLPFMNEVEPVHGAPVWSNTKQVFGVDTLCGWPCDVDDVERYDFDIPVIFLQRVMDYKVGSHVAIARANGQIVIQDIDDDFWSIPKWNSSYAATHPSMNKECNTDFYLEGLANSNLIVASTPYLAEKMSEVNDHVVLIENHVNVDSFEKAQAQMGARSDVRVGWTGDVAMKVGDLACLRSVASMFKWHHIGDKPGAHLVGVLGEHHDITTSPLCASSEYASHFTFDVGVVPLNHSAIFNQSKSFIKGLEYSAAGMPFVASPTPEYVRLHEELGIGFLAPKTKMWAKWLKALVNDRDLRELHGMLAQAKVRERYDVRIGAAKLQALAVEALRYSGAA